MKKTFIVTGMSCAACSAKVEKSVAKIKGVHNVVVNLLTNSMVVEFNDKTVINEIINTVKHVGYGINLDNVQKQQSKPEQILHSEKLMLIRLIVSFVFWLPLMVVSMGHMFFKDNAPFLYRSENAGIFVVTQILLLLPIIFANQKYFMLRPFRRALPRLRPRFRRLLPEFRLPEVLALPPPLPSLWWTA